MWKEKDKKWGRWMVVQHRTMAYATPTGGVNASRGGRGGGRSDTARGGHARHKRSSKDAFFENEGTEDTASSPLKLVAGDQLSKKGSTTCKNLDLALVAAAGKDGERVDPNNIPPPPPKYISPRDLKRLEEPVTEEEL